MFLVKIGDPDFWAEYDASNDDADYPLKVGDRIFWAGSVETSKGTILKVEPEFEDSITILYDRYAKHNPGGIRLEERELRNSNGVFYKIIGSESK